MRPRSDTLLVWTGAPCSYGCSACPIDQTDALVGIQPADLQQSLALVPATAGRLVVFLGGEPFLRRDLMRLIAVVRAAGCAPGIITTGRALMYPQVREGLRRAGLAYLRIQLFGLGEAHDRTTAVAGGFDQALVGLHAWVSESDGTCDVDVALSTRGRPVETVVTEIESLARELPAASIQIVIALDPAETDAAQSTESLHRAVAALSEWNADDARPLLVWEGLPQDVSAASAACLTLPMIRPAFVAGTPRACCLGAVEAVAHASAAPRQETYANSFNFVRTTTSVPWSADAAACTAYRSAGADDLNRQLWLINGEHLDLYLTDTGDFTPAEIARVKDEWSHLFVDQAAAGVLDDFTEGMRRVLPDPTCDACANRARCARRYKVIEGPPFAREEAWIADYVARLRGRVLDVGCGEQLYRNEITPLIRSGAIHYTGIDPDEVSLTRLRAAIPEARFILGGIEDFHGEPASYDHILCLRALNHVVDVDEAFARMAALLKPGGSLLLVECTPFAMLRRRDQVEAADNAPRAGQQHFRNVSSLEVLPFARRRSLQVLHHRTATLRTTNEWILLLGR